MIKWYLFIIITYIYTYNDINIYIYINVGLCFLDGDYGYLTYFTGIWMVYDMIWYGQGIWSG